MSHLSTTAALIHPFPLFERATAGFTQFIVATHSPILLTYPDAVIVSFDDGALGRVRLEDTTQYQITRSILEHPEVYWRHLRGGGRRDE